MTKLFEENLRDSTVTDRSKQSPSGDREAVENQPEPEGVRGTSGMSGNQGTDEPAAWCVMESDVLNGERFLLVRDDLYSSDQLADRITEQARSQADAIYTMTEMNHITAAELTDEDKRKLHALKKAFGGDVIGDDPAGEAFPCVDISDWIESNGG
jgi:hypothetical protein